MKLTKPTKIYNDNIEYDALEQFNNVMSQEWVLKGALMPDAHAGYVMPIGGVVPLLNIKGKCSSIKCI